LCGCLVGLMLTFCAFGWYLLQFTAGQAIQELRYETEYFFVCNVYIQGGLKKWTCLSVDNSAMVTRRKACDMSHFHKF